MRTDHGFPSCGKCLATSERWDLFVDHAKACPDTETQPCPYPACHDVIYTNRPEWTKQHFFDLHDGFTCSNCLKNLEHSALSAHAFVLHVDKCMKQHTCPHCDLCFHTAVQKEQHECSTQDRMHIRQMLQDSGLNCTDLVLQQGSTRRNIVVRIRAPTPMHLPQITEVQKHRMKFHNDPSVVELMSSHNLPVSANFMPRENPLEENMRLLYELETNQSASAFWLMLVLRVCDLGEHRHAHDVLHLERLLQSIQLPPGLDEACRSLHVIRNRVNLIKQRASHHSHVKLLVQTKAGELVPLNTLLKKFGKAIGTLEEEQRFIEAQPVDAPICPNSDPQVRKEMTEWFVRKGYPLPQKRKRLEDAGGMVEATLPSYLSPVNSELVNSRPLNWSLSDVSVSQDFRNGLDALDEDWQAMLYRFYKDILTPIVDAQSFERLKTWKLVTQNFLSYNNLPVKALPTSATGERPRMCSLEVEGRAIHCQMVARAHKRMRK